MRFFLKFSRKNPLERFQDRTAKQIIKILSNLSLDAKDEIVRMVVKDVYGDKKHIHANPKASCGGV